MKKAILISVLGILLFTTVSSYAEGIRFHVVETKEVWDSIQNVSLETGRPVMAVMYADWCKYCKLLDKEVFSDIAVADYISRYFITVKMDGEKGFGRTFAGLYAVKGFPTIFFMNGSGVVLQRVNGYVEQSAMLEYARKSLRRSDLIPIAEKKYRLGTISPSEMLIYLDYTETSDRPKAVGIALDFLDALSMVEYSDRDIFRIITTYAVDPTRRYPRQVLERREELIKTYGEEVLKGYFSAVYSFQMDKAIAAVSDSLLLPLFPLLEMQVPAGDLTSAILDTRKVFYAETGQPEAYERVIREAVKSEADSAEFLYEQAWDVVIDYGIRKGFPEMADRLMDTHIAMAGESFDACYLQSYINTLIPDPVKARKMMEKCEKLAVTKKEKELTDQLLMYVKASEAGPKPK
jgi:thioredoxin-related protein